MYMTGHTTFEDVDMLWLIPHYSVCVCAYPRRKALIFYEFEPLSNFVSRVYTLGILFQKVLLEGKIIVYINIATAKEMSSLSYGDCHTVTESNY
jgi:hypothetical protein